jgi:uncharacterized protein (DUF2236 family)
LYAIHAQISGLDLNGQPYEANEPILIKWVHLVEALSFLSAYQHLSRQPLSTQQCDSYMAEMSQVGQLLGAQDLPLTCAATDAQLHAFQSSLVFDERAKETVRIIESYPVDVLDQPFMQLVLQSAMDIMPSWALSLMGRQPSCVLQVQARRVALQWAAEPVQWMLDKQGVAAVSRQRVMG